MEYRMYCLAERHLSAIQKAIQSAHAVVEYGLTYGDTPEYKQWAEKDKTLIVLEGGNSIDLEAIIQQLTFEGCSFETFYEPDMDNFMTAIALVADERVFDYKTYGKSYEDYQKLCEKDCELPKWTYEEWVNVIGGRQNEIIKSIVSNCKLAI